MHPRDDGEHVDDQLLAALALGEDDGSDELARARDHVATCTTCAEEVGELRVTLALVTSGADDLLVAPPPAVWAAIAAELGHDSEPAGQTQAAQTHTSAPTPAAAPAPEPTEAPHASVTELSGRRRGVPTWLAAVAASVTLLVGVGGGMLIAGGDDPAEEAVPEPTVVSSTDLVSLDADAQERGRAQVRRQDDQVALHVDAQSLDGPDGIREVWLLNVDGSRMISLGLLSRGEQGDFEFPVDLLDEGYRIVDISYEPRDGDPTHSGRSLARGTLEG
ncbi:anti-sigma factor [Nocardioides campestrisoli]|uniref:anti-sigma factor n=1 Tax=Nocardioides campestrisoli TaxID=2736757 RepID=UPI0015E740A6|nr:anti-sigma factor [Nocardioides campestrisoli]